MIISNFCPRAFAVQCHVQCHVPDFLGQTISQPNRTLPKLEPYGKKQKRFPKHYKRKQITNWWHIPKNPGHKNVHCHPWKKSWQHELYLNPGLCHWNQWLYPWAIALDWELAHCKPQTLLSFHLSSFSRTFSRIMLSCIGKYFELGYHMYNLLNFLRHFPNYVVPETIDITLTFSCFFSDILPYIVRGNIVPTFIYISFELSQQNLEKFANK